MRTTAVVAAVLLTAFTGLTACSDKDQVPTSSGPTSTGNATTRPPKMADTVDYAAAVGQFAEGIRTAAADMDGCVAVKQCASTAIITRATVGLAKDQLDLTESSRGVAPPEVASLVADTRAAIDKAIAALDPINHEDVDPTAAIAAMDALAALMDLWTPYGA